MTTRTVLSLALLGGVLPMLAISVGCGGKETTASKSAAAYDEAQRKGVAPTGGAHGGHGGAGASPMPAGPHAMSEDTGAGAAAAAGASPSRMDHSRMAGMDHANAPAGSGAATPGMDHSKMTGSAVARPRTTMPAPPPERPSATARPGQPAATLGPDDIDAPAPTSVDDAARSAAMARAMSGGHAMQHGAYRQRDAGRGSLAPLQPEESHEGHGPAPQPRASPRPSPTPGAKDAKR